MAALTLLSALATGTAHGAASLLEEIASAEASSKGTFGPLLGRWQRAYDRTAVEPLLEIAARGQVPEDHRYIALVAAGRLGGKPVAQRVAAFLRAPSWLIRTAALRVLEDTGDAATAPQVLALLRDPALAVRLEAVTAVEKLQPPGAIEALVQAALAPENYAGGKALWVPQRAISALISIKAPPERLAALKPLLARKGDSELRRRVALALKRQ